MPSQIMQTPIFLLPKHSSKSEKIICTQTQPNKCQLSVPGSRTRAYIFHIPLLCESWRMFDELSGGRPFHCQIWGVQLGCPHTRKSNFGVERPKSGSGWNYELIVCSAVPKDDTIVPMKTVNNSTKIVIGAMCFLWVVRISSGILWGLGCGCHQCGMRGRHIYVGNQQPHGTSR